MSKLPSCRAKVVDLTRLTMMADAHQVLTVVKTKDVEVIHLCIPERSGIPTYEAAGEIVLHCLRGKVVLEACDMSCELMTGQLLYLHSNDAFTITGIEDAEVLATIIAPKLGPNVQLIGDKES